MPDVVEHDVAAEALAWPARARTIQVRDPASYQHAAGALLVIKALIKKIEDAYNPHVQRAHDAHKALIADRNAAAAPLVEAEKILKVALAVYDTEQEEQRQAEERRLRELAREQEEQRRLDEAAQLEREARATDDPRKLAEARELLARPIEVPTIIVPRETPRVAGISHREMWTAKLTSLARLIQWVAGRPEMENLLLPNQAALNALARAQQAKLKIDGVEPVLTPTVAARR